MSSEQGSYYVPEPSQWPIIGMCSLLSILLGTVLTIHNFTMGTVILVAGFCLLFYLFYGWFSDVINESLSGKYNQQVDRSMRIGMLWFISSELFFFLAFFGALFYIRVFALPWISGEGYLASTNQLYQGFQATWPSSGPVDTPFSPMGAMGIPLLNTILLLSSGATITWAHHALIKQNRQQLLLGLFCTVILGITFAGFQAYEYIHAYNDLDLTLKSGVYGSTFFMLTGFHGFHVLVGVTMLIVIFIRAYKNHFNPKKHFAFEAVAWYWHFVDVVWLGLYTFVYWV